MKHKILVFGSAGLCLFTLGLLDNPWNYGIAVVFGALFYLGIEMTVKQEGDEAINDDKSRYALIGVIAISFMVIPWFDWSGEMVLALAVISLAFASLSLWAISPSRNVVPQG
ncbi:hypothetical protein ACFP47_11635 [Nesterenkonia lacusekhoensis]|uniref:DUF2178 domain-containing protein n=1 Tax=Nesterenkonia lacusekhoensis TaxID=150832 RepID=A0ABS4T3T8_9MICC|nr:hypothetical protein [Nesterenkonia lacusekhoensis]MBP2319124.1 hypothetical protein [Nesterenkonia lacusekhoensis]